MGVGTTPIGVADATLVEDAGEGVGATLLEDARVDERDEELEAVVLPGRIATEFE